MDFSNSQKPIDQTKMLIGDISLVRYDIVTDLPYEHLINNTVEINLKAKSDSPLFILDQDSIKELSVIKTLGCGVINQQNWAFISDFKYATAVEKPIKTLSVLTYNIWFEAFYRQERYKVILKMLEQSKADFICLQEVILDFQIMLFQEKWVQDQYFVTAMDIKSYGVLILSKWPCKFYEKKFPTKMDRSLLIAQTLINQRPVFVATAHFESLNNAELRKTQLDISFPLLKMIDDSFLMGDFNFDSSWKAEQANIDKDFTDIYLDLNHGQEYFTMPQSGKFAAWRPDKIISKKSSTWQPSRIDIIGKFPIPSFVKNPQSQMHRYKTTTTPSDHYGLYAQFQFKDEK